MEWSKYSVKKIWEFLKIVVYLQGIMKDIVRKLMAALVLSAGASTISVHADSPVQFGVRVGMTTSDMTGDRLRGREGFSTTDFNQGLVLGGVCDIAVGPSFSIQPGIFYDLRRSNFKTSYNVPYGDKIVAFFDDGSMSFHDLQIPVIVAYHLPMLDLVDLSLEAGPYLSLGLGGTKTINRWVFDGGAPSSKPEELITGVYGKKDEYNTTNWGIKAGVGLGMLDKLYLGVHYLAGCRDLSAVKEQLKGAHSQEWQISLGYNF